MTPEMQLALYPMFFCEERHEASDTGTELAGTSGGAVQVESICPIARKRLVSQPLNLQCDILVSSLCFQIQLVPLHSGEVVSKWRMKDRMKTMSVVGLDILNAVDP
jgi:hypothetical protein